MSAIKVESDIGRPPVRFRHRHVPVRCRAVVLAAGEGSRLRGLTSDASGAHVPKQYWSLRGGPTLLRAALTRAANLAGVGFVGAVVAEDQRKWWESALAGLAAENVWVQPLNRGTAIGILLPLLALAKEDENVPLVLMPADHYIEREPVLAAATRAAIDAVAAGDAATVLLGITPATADPDLGYIVPNELEHGRVARVREFVEKPAAARAAELRGAGAVWNSFILASTPRALLRLMQARMPEVVRMLRDAVEHDRGNGRIRAVPALYQHLPSLDFSRDVLQGQEDALHVLRVTQCGWTDLGTSERVLRALQRHRLAADVRQGAAKDALSLDTRYPLQPVFPASAWPERMASTG